VPIYEYTCQDCQTQFEKLVRSITAQVEVRCPQCGGTHVKKGWSVCCAVGASKGLGHLSSSAAGSCDTGGT
jgi:putative FmdB family regulatory protein